MCWRNGSVRDFLCKQETHVWIPRAHIKLSVVAWAACVYTPCGPVVIWLQRQEDAWELMHQQPWHTQQAYRDVS